MTTATQSLADFLLDRLQDDQDVAQAAMNSEPFASFGDDGFEDAVGLAESEGARPEAVTHIARHDPARVLAEVEAKRHLVEVVATWAQQADYYSGDPGDMFAITYKAQAISGETVLRHLAAPYASHEDFQEGWRA